MDDRAAGGERFEAWTLVILKLEELEEPSLFARRSNQAEVPIEICEQDTDRCSIEDLDATCCEGGQGVDDVEVRDKGVRKLKKGPHDLGLTRRNRCRRVIHRWDRKSTRTFLWFQRLEHRRQGQEQRREIDHGPTERNTSRQLTVTASCPTPRSRPTRLRRQAERARPMVTEWSTSQSTEALGLCCKLDTIRLRNRRHGRAERRGGIDVGDAGRRVTLTHRSKHPGRRPV